MFGYQSKTDIMNILVYEMCLSGHRLEYLHHLYLIALDMQEDHFYFVLPETFNNVKDLLFWPEAKNVTIELKPSENEWLYGRPSLADLFRKQRQEAKTVNHYIKKFRIHRLFAIKVIDFSFFFPFFLLKGVKIDGIQYSLFPWADKNFLVGKLDYLKYMIYIIWPCFNIIYTLNDKKSAEKLDKIFHTSKFKFLPDPFMPVEADWPSNFRKEHGIGAEQVVFAHFGGLSSRKGTLLIMESLKSLSKEEKEKYVFVFAGRVYEDIKAAFYELYDNMRGSVRIIVKDEFISYSELASLCCDCNAILIPYFVTNQSSGIIGYASQFGKPVIAPSKGLLGQLVSEFRLGITLPLLNTESLKRAYETVSKGRVDKPTRLYCEKNNVKNFQSVIIDGFNKR